MLLTCPKCHKRMNRCDGVFRCEDGHSYDIARQGYVNLVLANQKHSQQPGDNIESLNARQQFLSGGSYQPLADRLAELVSELMHDGGSFLDAGCGTGYYLRKITEKCSLDLSYYAVDIARKGVAMTARAVPEAVCFVGNVFHLPFEDGTLDGLMSVFCPYSGEEFARIIKEGGYVIAVTPGARHLYQMKQIVYSEVYLNDEKGYDLPQFELVSRENVTYDTLLKDRQTMETLWRMTPYYHTTYSGNNEKLLERDQLEVTCDFLVCVYRRKP